MLEIMQISRTLHRFMDEEHLEDLNAPVTMGEIEGVLKWFKKDKILGPDGWTIEFYLTFFDIISKELLQVIEDIKTSG